LLPAFAGLAIRVALPAITPGSKNCCRIYGFVIDVMFLGARHGPFRVAAVICILAAIGKIALTWLLSEPEIQCAFSWDVLKAFCTYSR